MAATGEWRDAPFPRAQSALLRCAHDPALAIHGRTHLQALYQPPQPRLATASSHPWIGADQPKAAARAKVSSDPLTDSRRKRGESPMEEQP